MLTLPLYKWLKGEKRSRVGEASIKLFKKPILKVSYVIVIQINTYGNDLSEKTFVLQKTG